MVCSSIAGPEARTYEGGVDCTQSTSSTVPTASTCCWPG